MYLYYYQLLSIHLFSFLLFFLYSSKNYQQHFKNKKVIKMEEGRGRETLKTLARNLCHRPESPSSTNTRSTYGDNYRAPYTFIRGVHLGYRERGKERLRGEESRGVPSSFPSLSLWLGRPRYPATRTGLPYPAYTQQTYTQQATYNVSC